MKKNTIHLTSGYRARRVLGITLILLMLSPLFGWLPSIVQLPFFDWLPAAKAAEEFVLLLNWEVTTSNNVALSPDRIDLELTPPHNSANANLNAAVLAHSVRLKVEFAPPQGVDAAPGEVEVRVPMYIFENRDGSYIVNTTLANSQGVHAVTTTKDHLSGLYYEIDDVTNEYVFKNWDELTGGIYTVVNVTYNYIPEKIKDGYLNDSIVATARYSPASEPVQEKESAPLSVKVNTFVAPPASFSVNHYRTSDPSQFKYESWITTPSTPNFGARPAGSVFGSPYSVFTADDVGEIYLGDGKYVAYEDIGKEKYYYLIWEIKYQRRANRSTQPYYINIDITLSEPGGGEIVGICGRDYFNNADVGLANTPFIGQAAAQINQATVVSPASFPSKTATVNLLTSPSSYIGATLDLRSDSYLQTMYRWVLVRYPRGEGTDLGYNVDTSLKATLTLTGIDHIDDPDEGTGSDPEDNAIWEAGQVGAETKPASPVAGRAYIGEPRYTHVREANGPVYNYKPVVHTYGGNLFQTLKYHLANSYAGNSVPTIYSAINKLSEGSVTNPVSVPVLRTKAETYSFRLRTEARGFNLTRAGLADIIPGIDSDDPRNYYQKDYTVEVVDGMKFLRDVRLAPDDYSITRSYLTYTEYVHAFNPNNGNLTAYEVPYYDGNPTPAQLAAMAPYAHVAPYAPIEIWYKTIFTGDNWLKAGEVKRTATSVYTYTTTDGTQLENPSLAMSASNQLKLPRGTYEIKYIHTSSRFQVNIDNYITVELNSTNRVLALLDGGVVDGVTYGRTDSAQLRNIHSLAVIDSAGVVRNTVPVANIYARSWPGATYNAEATVAYQNIIEERSRQLYNTSPGESVEQHYTYVNLNRTVASTVIDKINTADRLDDSYVRNGYVADNTIKDDGVNGLKSIHQSVRIYDQIYYNPDLVPGNNREEKLEDLADNNIFKQVTEGTYFDLLPPGTYIEGEVEAFTSYFDPYASQGNATVEAQARIAHEANRKDALVNWYTVDNWQGSGRTMLVANVKAPGATNYQVYDAPAGTKWMSPSGVEYEAQAANANVAGNVYRIAVNSAGYERILSGFVLNYNLVTTYANIFDRSDAAGNFNAYNVAAFRNRTGRLASGANTVPTSAPWNYRVSGGNTAGQNKFTTPATTTPATYSFFMALESDFPTRDDNIGAYNTAYATNTTAFPIPDAYNYGISKHVRAQSDPDFIQEAQTIPGGIYQYQLHFLSGPSKIYTEIKMFDILEDHRDPSGALLSEWKGTLIDVDTSFARSLGCDPVVYYSTVSAEELKLISDPVSGVYSTTDQAEFDAEIDDELIWSATMPSDKSTITAIAVDFTKATNGSNFRISKGDSIYVVVNMLAPTDPVIYEPIIASDLEAKNRIAYSTVELNPYNEDDKAITVRWSEPTSVTMRNVDFDIGKTAFPASGTFDDAQAVDRGDRLTYTLAVMNLDILPAKSVTVVDTIPDGLLLDKGDVRYYSGTNEGSALSLPTWIKLTRNWADDQPTDVSGQTENLDGRKLTFVIEDMYAQQTINLVIPTTVDPEIEFGTPLENAAVITGINGADYDIESEVTYHKVYPRVTLEGLVTLDDRYLRVNEFEFVLVDDNASSPTYGEVLSQVKNDKDGNFVFTPLDFKEDGTYTYIISEIPNTVPSGNLPTSAPGEVVYDDTTYTVTIEVTTDSLTGEMTTVTTITKTGETEETGIVFGNQYLPDPVYMPLELNKILNGRVMSDGEFKFSIIDNSTGLPAPVYDNDGNVLAGGLESAADGLTGFRLRFSEPGEYVYEVREVIPGLSDSERLENVDYDEGFYTITIVVGKTSVDPQSAPTPINSVQRNDGRLSIANQPEILDAGGNDARIGFTNKYTPTPVSATIMGTKVLNGGRPLVAEEFSFVLTDVTDPLNPVIKETVKNDSAGKITFAPITYTDEDAGTYGKTFYYTVSEVVPEPADPNITYAAPVSVRVNIGIDRDLGELSSSVVNQGFVMTNVYTPDSVSVQLTGQKLLTGANLLDGQFSFVLRNTTNPDPAYHMNIETVTNNGSGAIIFSPIMYTAPGEYKYSIRETSGSDSKIKYDTAVYDISVTVTQNTSTGGELEVGTPVISGGGSVVFTNTKIHDVSFNLNYDVNSTHATESVIHDDPIGTGNMPPDPSRPGWTFLGWGTTPGATTQDFDGDTPITGDTTVYAIWEAIEYTVTFDWNDGGVEPDQEISGFYYEDTMVSTGKNLPVPPERPGYTFLGWNTQADGAGAGFGTDTPVTDDIRIYAMWSHDDYMVTYAPGEHGNWDPADSAYTTGGLKYGDPTPPEPAATPGDPGWTFTGWFPAPAATVTGDATYVAQWSRDEYTVVFDRNDGSTDTQAVSGLYYDESIDAAGKYIPGDPQRPGYIFKGWNTEDDGSGSYFDATVPVTEDTTVYAIWEAIPYTVIYEPGLYGNWTDETYSDLTYGDSMPEPPYGYEDSLDGDYVFAKWSQIRSDTVTEHVTYVALWAREDTYIVSFYPGDFGDFKAEHVYDLMEGDFTPEPPAMLGMAGWSFAGWDVEISSTVYGHADYIALWEQDEYTVVFDPGLHGAWDAAETTTFGLHYGDPMPLPPLAPGGSGWTFVGWDIEWSTNVDGHVTYVALWETSELLTVTFMTNDGSDETYATEDIYFKETLDDRMPDPPQRDGYRFLGWADGPGGGAVFTEDTQVADHMTVYAIWETMVYTVTYAPGDYGAFDETVYGGLYFGDFTPAPPETEGVSGWTFTGWSTERSETVTDSVTYVAQWKKKVSAPLEEDLTWPDGSGGTPGGSTGGTTGGSPGGLTGGTPDDGAPGIPAGGGEVGTGIPEGGDDAGANGTPGGGNLAQNPASTPLAGFDEAMEAAGMQEAPLLANLMMDPADLPFVIPDLSTVMTEHILNHDMLPPDQFIIHAGDNYYVIYDEFGMPTGYFYLPEGVALEEFNILEWMSPLATFGALPKTGDTSQPVALPLLGMLTAAFCGMGIFAGGKQAGGKHLRRSVRKDAA